MIARWGWSIQKLFDLVNNLSKTKKLTIATNKCEFMVIGLCKGVTRGDWMVKMGSDELDGDGG